MKAVHLDAPHKAAANVTHPAPMDTGLTPRRKSATVCTSALYCHNTAHRLL